MPASLIETKRRIVTIQSTEKITKAMKLVSLCDNKLKNVEEQVNKILTENGTLENFEVTE